MDTTALLLTLRLALTTTIILMAIALPAAHWLTTTRTRLKAPIQALIALPLVLPPTVLGFYLLVLLGPLTPIGRTITNILGHPLAFSFSGLLIGSIIYSLPFAIQPLVSGFAAIPTAYAESAATLGAPPLKVFRTITLPLAKSSLITAAVLTFTHTVGEFGVVLMLGGNIPGATRTLSISLFDQVQDFNYAAANRTALILLAFSFAALLLIYARPHKRAARA